MLMQISLAPYVLEKSCASSCFGPKSTQPNLYSQNQINRQMQIFKLEALSLIFNNFSINVKCRQQMYLVYVLVVSISKYTCILVFVYCFEENLSQI